MPKFSAAIYLLNSERGPSQYKADVCPLVGGEVDQEKSENLEPFAQVLCIADNSVTARSLKGTTKLLDDGSHVFDAQGNWIGDIGDIFGQVISPLYSIHKSVTFKNNPDNALKSGDSLFFSKCSESNKVLDPEQDIDKYLYLKI